jgi:NAD(P)-dependent dehydrogenase (short-subunit alcohol dehydrogenase family)
MVGIAIDLTGRAAVVTGGTTGIGEACARTLAQAGAHVLFTGRNPERAEAVKTGILRDGGVAEYILGDMREAGIAERIVDTAVQKLGGLDVLVNNAGILVEGTAEATSDAQWQDTMDVNVTSVFRMSRAALRIMVPRGRGVIVNLASEWGLNGEKGYVAYCASKGAIVQMTRSMGIDHAPQGIRINSVCPGEVHTEMVDEMLKTMGLTPEGLAKGIPMRRLAKPSEVANCILFLASDLASYVTATNFSVDGGNDAIGGPYP